MQNHSSINQITLADVCSAAGSCTGNVYIESNNCISHLYFGVLDKKRYASGFGENDMETNSILRSRSQIDANLTFICQCYGTGALQHDANSRLKAGLINH